MSPSFILRDLEPEFWSKVKAKADAEGVTVKELILRLLTQWLGAAAVLLALLSTGCALGYDAVPSGPSPVETTLPPAPPQTTPTPTGPPFSIQIDANGGQTFIDTQWQTTVTVAGRSTPARVTVNCNNGAPLQEYPGFSGVRIITCAFGTAGTYPVVATALSADGFAATDRTNIVANARPVSPPPPPPPPPAPARLNLSVTCTPKSAPLPTPCNVTATYNNTSVTSDLDDVRWDWGDGDTSHSLKPRAATTQHPYTQTGTYRLVVTTTYAGTNGETSTTLVIP